MANSNELDRTARCGTCKFFDAMTNGGACRKGAPTAYPLPGPAPGSTVVMSVWAPVSAERDWCGDYSADQLVDIGGAS